MREYYWLHKGLPAEPECLIQIGKTGIHRQKSNENYNKIKTGLNDKDQHHSADTMARSPATSVIVLLLIPPMHSFASTTAHFLP
jgi:hypothetical protein